MYPSVQAAFEPFTAKIEGYMAHPYLDDDGYVTTGMGNKIDPLSDALALPWKVNSVPIDAAEITRQWTIVKNSGMAGTGGGNQASLSTMRLDDDGIRQVIAGKLAEDEAVIMQRIPGWPSLPADAQLGILSVFWAAGAYAEFPKFLAAINAFVPDWDTAVQECWLKDNDIHGPNNDPPKDSGLRAHNLANQQLFRNAKVAVASGDPSTLLFDVAAFTAGASAAASSVSASYQSGRALRDGIMFGGAAVAAGGLAWWIVDPKSFNRSMRQGQRVVVKGYRNAARLTVKGYRAVAEPIAVQVKKLA